MNDRGHAIPIEPERKQWLERLIDACEQVLARAPDAPDDHHLRAILTDVATLRAGLLAELRGG